MTKVRGYRRPVDTDAAIIIETDQERAAPPADEPPFAVTLKRGGDPYLPQDDPKRQQLAAALAEAEDIYARATAVRRSSELATLVEGGRWRQRFQRVLHPWAFRRALTEYQENERGREAYKTALHNYLGVLGLQSIPQSWEVEERAKQGAQFETRVLEHQMELSQPARGHPLQFWLAEHWMEWGKSRRAAVVAAPALFLGLGAGAVTAFLGLPVVVLAGAGIGTAAAGRYMGGRIAKAVNRHRAATDKGYEQLYNNASARIARYRGYYLGEAVERPEDGSDWADITAVYEAGTRQAAQENARRFHAAQALGGIAAGAGFAAANLAMHAPQFAQAMAQAHTQSTHHAGQAVTAGEHIAGLHTNSVQVPHSVVPHPPAGLAHEYPWTAATQWNSAHHIVTTPDKVWSTLHHAAAAYNQSHGTNFGYVLHSNGTWWLQNGAQQLTSDQLASFNTYLWSMPA